MRVIGITGIIGSGKTTVAGIIKEKTQAIHINSDDVAKSLYKTDENYLKEVIEVVGDILTKGELDKKKLANILFSDKEKKKEIDAITFRYVFAEIEKIIRDNNHKMILIESALLFESKLNQLCDSVIAVISNTEDRINRLAYRSNLSKEEVMARIHTQKQDSFFIEYADYIIYNNLDDSDLKKKVQNLLMKII